MGDSPLHHGPEGTLRVQREPVHLHDHLQRVPLVHLPQRIHVSSSRELTGSISDHSKYRVTALGYPHLSELKAPIFPKSWRLQTFRIQIC